MSIASAASLNLRLNLSLQGIGVSKVGVSIASTVSLGLLLSLSLQSICVRLGRLEHRLDR